jgi:hypothetical protein
MHQELRRLISADKLLDEEDQRRHLPIFQAFWQGQEVDDGEAELMHLTLEKARKRFEQSMPDFEALIDSSLIHELNKLSEDFKHAWDCFGFDVPNYNNAFLLYESKLSSFLEKRIRNARAGLPVEQRETANAICAEMKIRVALIYGPLPFPRLRIPMMTPSTFRAMAETLMRFPDAIAEVSRSLIN